VNQLKENESLFMLQKQHIIKMPKELLNFIDANKDKIINLTQRLVRTKTVHGNEEKAALVIKHELKKYDIGSILRGPVKNRKNLIATLNGEEKGKTLLLNAHTDTVPAGDLNDWKYPPFSATIVGNRMYGRGALDTKSGLAAMVYAFIALKETRTKFAGTLMLGITYDEESGTFNGVKELVKAIPKPDASIIGEPVRRDGIPIGSRGFYRFKAITTGKAYHTGSAKPKGFNSVTQMSKFILTLDKMRPHYVKNPLFPPPLITPGTKIKGGTGINIIPDRCKALFDCRLSFGQTKDTIKNDIKQHIESLKKRNKRFNIKIKELSYEPPVITRKNDRIVRKTSKHYESIMRKKPKLLITGGSTDGNILIANGIPSVILGPDGGNIHAKNEYVEINSLIKVAKIYVRTVADYLN